MRSWNRIAKTLMVGLTALGACSDNEVIIVTRPVDVAIVTNVGTTMSAVLFAAADPFVPGGNAATTPEQAAALAATNVNTYYAGNCATATASGATVNYQLNDCRGPLGIVGVSGNYTVTYATSPNGMQITVASSNLTVGGATAAINATAVYTQINADRSLAFTDRSTARGNSNDWVFNRTGTLAWTQGQSCATENSSGTLTVNGTPIRLTLTDVVRCAGQCVVSGTEALSASDGTTGTVTFGGTATPVLVASTGIGDQTLVIACTPTAVGNAVTLPPQR